MTRSSVESPLSFSEGPASPRRWSFFSTSRRIRHLKPRRRPFAPLRCLQVNPRPTAHELIDRLSASNESFRRALHEALLHGDTATRQGAAYLAVLCRDESSLEAVLQAVADDVVSPETVEALRASGSALIDPLLMQRGAEPRVWAIALELAAELSYRHLDEVPAATRDRIRSLIERDLTDATDAVRAAAAESLLWWGDPRDCRALVECLSSPSHQVRAAATSALEGLAKRVPDAVEEALREADLDGPGGADIAHVLSRLASPRAEELLKRGLHSGEPRTRRAAVQALAMANASDMAQLIGYAVADEDIDVQIAAVRTLGQMSTTEANDPLRTALDSPFAPTRAEAALALGRREANGAIPRIRALLEDSEPVVVSAALDALAWLGDSEVATAVERALSHADDEIFQAGLRAAGTLPGRSRRAAREPRPRASGMERSNVGDQVAARPRHRAHPRALAPCLDGRDRFHGQARDRERPSARCVT